MRKWAVIPPFFEKEVGNGEIRFDGVRAARK